MSRTNITGYNAVNGRVIVKSIAHISTITIGAGKKTVATKQEEHFIIDSANIDMPVGSQVILDPTGVEVNGISILVLEDEKSASNVFKHFEALSHIDKAEVIQTTPTLEVHSYYIIHGHDILAVKPVTNLGIILNNSSNTMDDIVDMINN